MAGALVSSGDPGIYGMASLAIDQAAALGEAAPELVMVPGVTAAIAVGALLGAPLAVDFVCLSLSQSQTVHKIMRVFSQRSRAIR